MEVYPSFRVNAMQYSACFTPAFGFQFTFELQMFLYPQHMVCSVLRDACAVLWSQEIGTHGHIVCVMGRSYPMAETFSALLAICAGNSPVPGDFPTQRPVTRSFDVFFHLRLNKRLSKQWWGWWFETLSRPFWRHRNGLHVCHQMSLVNPTPGSYRASLISHNPSENYICRMPRWLWRCCCQTLVFNPVTSQDAMLVNMAFLSIPID